MTRATLCVRYPITAEPGLKQADLLLPWASQIMVKRALTRWPGTLGVPFTSRSAGAGLVVSFPRHADHGHFRGPASGPVKGPSHDHERDGGSSGRSGIVRPFHAPPRPAWYRRAESAVMPA